MERTMESTAPSCAGREAANQNTLEVWRSIPGYEGLYEVSSLGAVRSLDRVLSAVSCNGKAFQRPVKGKMLSRVIGKVGYPVVRLSDKNGLKTGHTNHRLVALAFLGPCPEGMEVCHNDDRKENATIANLRYDTRTGNSNDRKLNGTEKFGTERWGTKLTPEAVTDIRKLRGTVKQMDLAARFGVSVPTISMVQSGKNWQWMT